MSKQIAYQLADEKYSKDILIAAEEEIKYQPRRTVRSNGITIRKFKISGHCRSIGGKSV